MALDRLIATLLIPLSLWILLSGLDDMMLDLAVFLHWLRSRFLRRGKLAWPSDAEVDAVPQKHIAIFVPLWKEHRVIRKMIEHNVAAQRYRNYDFFIGAYPNDGATLNAVRELTSRFPNVHLAVCPHDGPTSKADCLNWIFQRLIQFENENDDARFDIVMTHDAEDLIHPDSLRYVNYFGQAHHMVQVPVLALPTPIKEWSHGVYCDEFAEYQTKDIPARQLLGGFLPSNGVGTGFSRDALERLAAAYSNRIFEPSCLTEDYENGFRVYRHRYAQKFIPLHKSSGNYIATREFFPHTFKTAVKQRSRWIMGIALQSWEYHGWRDTLEQLYWFWRDRKGLVGNLVSPLANLIFAYGLATWMWARQAHHAWGLSGLAHTPWLVWTYEGTLALQLFHTVVRAWCSGRIYGWKFAAFTPLRSVWGNWINCCANVTAIKRYAWAKITGAQLTWSKTEHAYPSQAALAEHKRRIGEVLVGSEWVTQPDLEAALAAKPEGMRIGEYLIQLGKLTEDDLYFALSLQQNVPVGLPPQTVVSRAIVRALPAECSRKWKVLPFKVAAGHLYVAGPELPSDEMTQDLQRFTSLEIRFHLVTPRDFANMAQEYLPAATTS